VETGEVTQEIGKSLPSRHFTRGTKMGGREDLLSHVLEEKMSIKRA